MPADAQIRITAENQTPQAFRQVDQSLKSLDKETRAVQSSTRQSAAALGLFDDEAKQAAIGVTNLGRQVFKTSAEAKRFGGVFQDQRGRLREANGVYAKTNEAVKQLGNTFRRTGRSAGDLDQGMKRASGGANILTRSVGSLGSVLGALSIATVVHEVGRLGVSSVQAAGQMEQLRRATEQIQGSASAAEIRISELIQVANLPGLNFEPLVRYSNQFATLGLSAEDTDKILLGVGQTVVSLGGTAASAELSIIQLLQAFRAGTIDMRDFRTIIQQIPGILNAAADVHGVEANIEGLREAFEKTGGSMRDLLIPTFDELSRRFEAPPADSYIVAMDTLQNAFFLTQSAIGDLLLPTITKASIALSEFLEVARTGLKDFEALPKPIADIVLGARSLYDALKRVAQSIRSVVGPPVEYLISNFGSLLGSVLELAGALYTALQPVLTGLAYIVGTVVTAVAQLAEHLTLLIGGLADGVNWLTSFWREEEQAVASTDKLTASIGAATDALEKNATAGDRQRARLRDLQTQLDETNAKIEDYEEKIRSAGEAGLSNRSIENLERLLETSRARIGELESEIETLAATYGGATAALDENATATEQQQAKLKDLQTQLEGVNQEIDTYVERIDKAKKNGDTISSIAQLEGWLTNTKKTASELQTEIDTLTGSLEASESATDASSESTGNFSLQLAKLKAQAEDAREALRNTSDFSALGANYQSAIAASDAYYNRQIANLQTLLAEQKEGSEEYNKTETQIFERQRQREQARQTLRTAATRQGESESKRRIEIIEKENEELRAAGEETTRALEASEKRRTAAAEQEQKRLTQVHAQNLKDREAAERASNQRSVQDSEERLSVLQNAFENVLPESVGRAYKNIQQATITHYETLKNQARQRITDEDALTAELVSLDRQRNETLQENHRDFLGRLSSDAKDLLGERTQSFRDASEDILHNWEGTVSEFERQLREADTEDAIREIESNFETGQQNMLASLEGVITELGFTTEQAADIMKEILRTAEDETNSFADKIISAFRRLGKEADRETKKQNREIKKSYRELVSEVEGILNGIRDFFTQIAQDGDLEVAFRDLGERLGTAVLDKFNEIAADGITEALLNISKQNITASAGTGGAARTAGAGSGLASAGSITGLVSLLTSPAILAAIVPAAVFAATYYIGKQVAGDSSGVPVNRQGRPLKDNETRRRRGETQSSYERRLQANADAEATEAQRQTFFDTYDPRAPILRSIQDSGVFTGNSGVFAENAANLTEIDVFGRVDLPGLIGELEGILQTRVEGLGEDMERAAASLENATGADIQPALQDYFTATTGFYQTQIDFANFIRRTTGHLDFGDVEGLSRQLQQSLNEARTQAPALDSSSRYNAYQRLLQSRQEQENIDEYNRLADEQGGVRHGEGVPEPTIEDTVDPELLSRLNVSNLQTAADAAIATFTETINAPRRTIDSINEAFTTLEPDLRELYDALYEGIAGEDGIINTAEEQIELNNLGSFEDFTERYTELASQATDAIRAAETALARYRTGTAFADTIEAFRESISAPGTTIAEINESFTALEPTLRAEFQRLRAEIVGEDGVIDATEQLALEQQGLDTFENFATPFEELRDTARTAIETTEQVLADFDSNSVFSGNVVAFKQSVSAVGQTVEAINTAFTTFSVSVLRPHFDYLRGQLLDDDGAISVAEELALKEAGLFSFEDFSAPFSEIADTAITGIETVQQQLGDFDAESTFSANVQTFKESLNAAGLTVEQVNQAFTTFVENVLRPRFESLRNQLLDDDGIIDAVEELALKSAGLFTFEDFTANFMGLRDAAVMGIEAAASALSVFDTDSTFDTNVEAFKSSLNAAGLTVADIHANWATFVEQTLRPHFEILRGRILDDDGIVSAAEELALKQAGLFTFEDFTDAFLNIRDAAVMGVETTASALQAFDTNSLFSANVEAFKQSLDAAGATVEGINQAFTTFQSNVLRPHFDFLRSQILDEDGVISASEALALKQAGVFSFEDYSAPFLALSTAAIAGIASAEQALGSYRTGNIFAENIEAFKETVNAVGATVEGINQAVTDLQPLLRAEFQRLRNGVIGEDGIISAAEQLILDQQGLDTFEDFSESFLNLADTARTGIQKRASQNRSNLAQNRSNLAQNRRNRSQFSLNTATSESEFETRRGDLITAINTYYDAELERINGLKLSEAELQDLREDNTLAREQALRSAETATNRFAEERISAEMRLQDEIADLRDDSVDAEADRLQAIADLNERHNDRVLEAEKRLQDDILDLRRDRAESAQDIATEFQRDLEDLRTEVARDLFGDDVLSFGDLTTDQQSQVEGSTDFQRESFDLERERQRDLQDLNTEFGVLRQESTAAFEYYRQALERGELSEQDILSVFGRRGLDDVQGFQGSVTDADADLASGLAAVNAEAAAAQDALTSQIGALTEQLGAINASETVVASVAEVSESSAMAAASSESAAMSAREATENISTAITEATTAATTLDQIVSALQPVSANLITAVDALSDLQSLERLAAVIDSLPSRLTQSIFEANAPVAENIMDASLMTEPLSLNPEGNLALTGIASVQPVFPVVSPQTSTPTEAIPVIITNISELQGILNNSDKPMNINVQVQIDLDGDQVGTAVENNIITRRQEGRSLL